MDLDYLFSSFEASPAATSSSPDERTLEKSLKRLDRIVKKRKSQVGEDDKEPVSKKKKSFLETFDLSSYQLDIKVKKVPCQGCLHEVTFPSDYSLFELTKTIEKPAKQYPFSLDPFQWQALLCLESNQSVLVSAHTSAGKTVVAEYAIAMSLKNQQKVIYTTPIKALSNQKYREFKDEFEDVGLMTGDVTINDTASCLIMTTEILRNMIYRGSDTLRGVAWVIFDEIHYMRDKERGVVWEESIILLPDDVRFVFLSATIPNARQFAEWISWLHKQACNVIYTDYRPIPLEYYAFPVGGEGLYRVMDSEKKFNMNNLQSCVALVESAAGMGKADRFQRGKKGGATGMNSLNRIIWTIKQQQLIPAIVFSFSRKECELNAKQLISMDFNTKDERTKVKEMYENAIDLLSEEDKKLPQVVDILPFLKHGIGIHHGGLLPIVKELIELLFSEGLVKVLFATETFAMGLNMPARTVIFTSLKKFDGSNFRFVSSGEFIQMSGRAGRRRLDDKGTIVIMVDQELPASTIENILTGCADPLHSAFHLTNNMILNMLRLHDQKPEDIMKKSFHQFQKLQAIPDIYEETKSLCEQRDSIVIPQEESMQAYCSLQTSLKNVKEEIKKIVMKPANCKAMLKHGRVIKVRCNKEDFGWGFSFGTITTRDVKVRNAQPVLLVQVVVAVRKVSWRPTKLIHALPPTEEDIRNRNEEIMTFTTGLDCITEITPFTSKTLPEKPIRTNQSRQETLLILHELRKKLAAEKYKPLHPVKDMGIDDPELLELLQKKKALKKKLHANPLHRNKEAEEWIEAYKKKKELSEEIEAKTNLLKQQEALLQLEDLKCQKRIFRRFQLIDDAEVVQMKGKVACEISSGDELLLTEMLYNGMFIDMDPHVISALLSCIIFEEKPKGDYDLVPELLDALDKIREVAKKIASVSIECRKQISEEDYFNAFKPHLMPVVYEWSKGKSFSEICQISDIYEGSIIRSLRRLNDLLRQMYQAASVIGNDHLEKKFSDCIAFIKRDIVFASSLYIGD